jgi:hypothetical protein
MNALKGPSQVFEKILVLPHDANVGVFLAANDSVPYHDFILNL